MKIGDSIVDMLGLPLAGVLAGIVLFILLRLLKSDNDEK